MSISDSQNGPDRIDPSSRRVPLDPPAPDDGAAPNRAPVKPDLMARLFDIRIIIGMLLGIFGLVLLVMGIFDTSSSEKSNAGGINVNLWTGLALVLVAAVFAVWSWLKPEVVPESGQADPDQERSAGP